MDTVQYIENAFLPNKNLTNGTANIIRAMVKAYGDKPLIYLLDKSRDYLLSKEYENQSHFESTILLILRKNAPYLKHEYETHIGEMEYNMKDEPPSIPKHDVDKKEVKQWVI